MPRTRGVPRAVSGGSPCTSQSYFLLFKGRKAVRRLFTHHSWNHQVGVKHPGCRVHSPEPRHVRATPCQGAEFL